MGMRDLLGIERKVDKFARESQGLSKEALRILETQLLKPDKLPPITEKVEYLTPLRRDYVKLKFRVHHDFDLFSRHFKVLTYVETNVTDLTKLLAILNALEEGVIHYEVVEEQYWPVAQERDEVRLVFPSPESYELFKTHFKVLRTSKELRAPELTKLIMILQDIEDGKVLYEDKKIILPEASND